MSQDAVVRRDPLLDACGVVHAFGVLGDAPPAELRRPRQVHGSVVAELDTAGRLEPDEADAVVSGVPGAAIGIVTADCVPVLAASRDGAVVAAIHVGWRGLAAGVVTAGLAALRRRAAGRSLRAAVGPHIRVCCYEVDGPVIEALRARFGESLETALVASRPAHAHLDLGVLVRAEFARAGLPAAASGCAAVACTRCHPDSYPSYRRDGARAGRLLHHIAARKSGLGRAA